MMPSAPEIITSSAESSWPKNSRRASFSGVQCNPPSGARFTSIHVHSLPVVTVRRSSVFHTQIQASELKQARSDTILEREQHRSALFPRRSITPREEYLGYKHVALSLSSRGRCIRNLPLTGQSASAIHARVVGHVTWIFQVAYSA